MADVKARAGLRNDETGLVVKETLHDNGDGTYSRVVYVVNEFGGGPATIADGADATQGAKADARSTATDTTPVTAMAVLKELSYMAQNPAAVGRAKGSKTFAQTSVSTATLLLATNASRKTASLRNTSSSVTVYLGKDGTVTSGNGYPLLPNEALTDDDSTDAWWAIAATGSVTVASVEVA